MSERTSQQHATRLESGSVDDNDPLVEMLYLLMRDHVPTGVVAGLVADVETSGRNDYTNGWLATYAQHLAKRLR